MELSKSDIKILKGIAILFMLMLHLFCRKDVHGLYAAFPMINGVPVLYYLALFGDACVPIYCFSSGYGFFISFQGTQPKLTKNLIRIFKLLINYWIVLFLFVAIGFFIGKTEYPGSLVKFLLNFLVVSSSYNGAWWFLQTYIILAFLAPLLVNLTAGYNSGVVLLISGMIYLLSYVQRFRPMVDLTGDPFLNMLVHSMVLAGTSQLPFFLGTVFAKERLYSRLYKKFYCITYKNTLCVLSIFLLVVLHAVYESMIIAPFSAILFICLFSLMDKRILVQKVLKYFSDHSTNIWLTHMFFYLYFFPKLVFAPKYPVIIFFWLLLLCVMSSYLINAIYKPIIRMIDKKYHFFITRSGDQLGKFDTSVL